MKSICLLSQKPGSSREAFRAYYEDNHAVLGMRHFPFTKYLRNHVVSASAPIDFDVVSEFYSDDLAKSGEIMAGPIGAIMDADEKRFMDQSLIRPAASEETILYGPPRDIAEPGTRRVLMMLDSPDVAALTRWARDFGEANPGVERISLDLTTPFAAGPRAFPFDAVLSLWLKSGETPPDAILPGGMNPRLILLVDVCESTPEELASLYEGAP
jgi:uncharacterized protein (TIGR02118 family)